MSSYGDRLARLEANRPGVRPVVPADLSAEVRALVAATPLPAGERSARLRELLARVDIGSATDADLALLADCSLATLRIVERLEASC